MSVDPSSFTRPLLPCELSASSEKDVLFTAWGRYWTGSDDLAGLGLGLGCERSHVYSEGSSIHMDTERRKYNIWTD